MTHTTLLRHRIWQILAPALLALLFFAPSHAAADGNGIATPPAGATLTGVVAVTGQASHPLFRKWQVDLLLGGDEQHATFLALGEKPQDRPGALFSFNTADYPNGAHKLRLRVVHSNLNYDEYFAPVTIRNTGAPELPVAPASDASTPDLASDAATVEAAAAPAADAPVAFRSDAPVDGKRWIEIDISDQKLTAWQGDIPVFETIVSTGKPGWRTLPGKFKVYVKYDETRMRGADYDTPDVPWTMYYSGAFAIHGAYWHNNFGTPVSHGCVNLRVPEAKALYEWASVGTEVVVNK
jgi:lipoprotein-anchoring transpeptidase ErfK/SrfK